MSQEFIIEMEGRVEVSARIYLGIEDILNWFVVDMSASTGPIQTRNEEVNSCLISFFSTQD